MSEIVRLRKKEIKAGMRIIIIALSPIKDASYEEIEKDIANLLEKIK
jgi:ribonuclease P protein component